MYTDVTIKADDFKAIHNALWSLQYGNGDLNAQVEVIRKALNDAYEQDQKASDDLYNHYTTVKTDLGLDAIWSIYEVKDLSGSHPYKGAKTITYKDNWGGDVFTAPINGFTWAALYVAANAAIRDSGDEHHVFIEGFRQVGDTLLLTTGS
jgi:hypothetical protein